MVFKAKKDVQAYFMLSYYDIGDDVTKEDMAQLLDLFRHHHKFETKAGCGVQRFTVRRPSSVPWGQPGPSQKCFWIVRTDGTSEDFSYLKCIDGLGKDLQDERVLSRLSEVYMQKALREEVREQVSAFRTAAIERSDGTLRCEVTGKAIPYPDEAHVDHAAPMTFQTLLTAWLAEEDIALLQVRLRDKGQMDRWREFHRKHAVLRMVAAEVNLGMLRRG